MNLFELFIKIGLDDGASKPVNNLASNLKGNLVNAARLGTSAVTGTAKAIGNGLMTAAKVGVAALGLASTALVALGKVGFEYNQQMETYTTNFEVMLGDAEKAARQVEQLKDLAAATPFEMTDLASATQTLLAFNVNARDTTDVLRRLGDISLGDSQKLASLTRAFGKMNAAQKVTLEDINIMIDAGFNPLLGVAEEMGVSMEEVYDKISKGEIAFEQITKAIDKATSSGGQFYKGMEKASKTTKGLISTLADNAKALVGEVFTPVSESLKNTVLPAAIEAIASLASAFESEGVEGLVDRFGQLLGGLLKKGIEFLPKIAELGKRLFSSMLQGFSENKEGFATAVLSLIESFAGFVSDFVPELIDVGIEILDSVLKGFAENPDKVIGAVSRMMISILNTLNGFFERLNGTGEQITGSIAEGFDFETISKGIAQLVINIVMTIVKALPDIIAAGGQILQGLLQGLTENMDLLMSTIVNAVKKIGEWIKQNAEPILDATVELLKAIASALEENLPALTETVSEIITVLVDLLTRPEMLSEILGAALQIIVALSQGLETAIPTLVKTIFILIENIVNFIVAPENAAKLINAGIRIVISLISGLISAIPQLLSGIGQLIMGIIGGFKDTDWGQVGEDIIDGIWGGLKNAFKNVKKWFKDAWTGLKDGFKDLFGLDDDDDKKKGGSHAGGLRYVPRDNYLANLHKGEMVLTAEQASAYRLDSGRSTSINGLTINVNVNEPNASAEDIGERVAEALQNLMDRRSAIYG